MGTELPYLVKTQICLAAFWIVYRLLFACDKAFALQPGLPAADSSGGFCHSGAFRSGMDAGGNRRRTVRFPHSGRDLHLEYNPKRSPAPDRAVFRRDSDCFATQAI